MTSRRWIAARSSALTNKSQVTIYNSHLPTTFQKKNTMNTPHAPAIEITANLIDLNVEDKHGDYGHGMTVKQMRERDDIDDWLEMQDDAEVAFVISEMAMRANRATRMSAYF